MISVSEYVIAMEWDGNELTVKPSNINAYFAHDAGTLVTWLKAGHAVTCAENDDLIDAVRAQLESGKGD